MTRKSDRSIDREMIKDVLSQEVDFLKPLVQSLLQEVLEAEMEETLGARKSERTGERVGYRSGHYPRSLVTRIGKIQLQVPQDRNGRFSTDVFERYARSEKALVSALAEMYINGVSTRKVKAITEELCGHAFSASTVSSINQKLDEQLTAFSTRRLEHEYPYLILDARYEKVRQDHVVRSQAVLVAIGINWEGRREVLGVELANRESQSSWRDFLAGLRERGLRGVELVITDDHAGLRLAIQEMLPTAAWQRCYVHFLRNALDHLPRKADDGCLGELRWLYNCHDHAAALACLSAWQGKWQSRYPKLCAWVEENIEQTLTFYHWPERHRKHLRSTNMLERQNEELKRRSRVIRIFPNTASCLRLMRALCMETHERWLEENRYIDMEDLRAHKKLRLIPRDERVAVPASG
jgi:transposase-like protein